MVIRTSGFVSGTSSMPMIPTRPTASVALALLFAAGYFASWSLLSSPFSAFPGDDVYTAGRVASANASMGDRTSVFDSAIPVYDLLAYSAMRFCRFARSSECDAGGVIQHLAIASNTAVLVLTGLIVFRVTNNLFAQFAGHSSYALAAWPVTYHFMVSYTVTTAALALLALYLILASRRESRLIPGVAGIAAALALWTSPAGPLTAGLLVLSVILLLWDGTAWNDLFRPSSHDMHRLGAFIAAFVTAGVAFGYNALQYSLDHLHHNINSPHYADIYQKLGFVPDTPFFSYLHVLGEYGLAGLLLFTGSLAVVLLLPVKANGDETNRRAIRVVTALAIFVVLHALLVDLLPSTKLARTHFPVYPISLVIVCVAGAMIHEWFARSRRARLLSIAFLGVALVALGYEGIRHGMETRHVRTAAIKYLDHARETTDWYLLQEDPHHGHMWMTFNWPLLDAGSIRVLMPDFRGLHGAYKPGNWGRAIRLITADKIPSLLSQKGRNPVGFVVGPHGNGSGLSVAGHAAFPDFNPAALGNLGALQSRIREIVLLPYYMHYPPFLMEEEISEALYFAGAIPDYRIPGMGITIIRL